MTPHDPLTLNGCAPTPLASYLKALGVLRLISSPANHVDGKAPDPRARGWWEGERFHLTTTLRRDDLIRFFLEDYAPSPIIAPWNGGSGFYPMDNRDGFEPLSSKTVAKRFIPMADAVRIASRTITRLRLNERPEGDAKTNLVATLRAELPDAALHWIDAALSLSGQRLMYPQLLGTGGNDGRLDFTSNFMRRLVSKKSPVGLFDASSGSSSEEARLLLASALFGAPSRGMSSAAVGQFAPGSAGGPNATTAFTASGEVNPWDFVLMLEGTTTFAGAATRRHQSRSASGASFPFTVHAVGAGWGGVAATDENDARAEFWAPLWSRPATFCEIDVLFAEGRAVLQGRTVRDGFDFARAAASLGVSRGFSEFERYGFLMRAGKAYLATPLGRRTAGTVNGTRLVMDLDTGGWLDRLRRVGRTDGESISVRIAVKRLEDALFDLMARSPIPDRVERVIAALGGICAWLAVSPSGRLTVGAPPPLLSPAWIRQADDGSAEFRVAAALAGLGLPAPALQERAAAESVTRPAGNGGSTVEGTNETSEAVPDASPARSVAAPPMAAHFAPINEKRFSDGRRLPRRRAWSDDASPPTKVWGAGDLVSNLIAVLERRLVETAIRGLDEKPLAAATGADSADVAAFLSGDFNDARCAELLAGLVWARPAHLSNAGMESGAALPFAYAVLKPIFTTDETLRRIGALDRGSRLPVPPGLVARLRAGGDSRDGSATDGAVRTALARARASGLSSPFDPTRVGGRGVDSGGGRIGAGVQADRLAAALLIPVRDPTLTSLFKRAYLEKRDDATEGANHAA